MATADGQEGSVRRKLFSEEGSLVTRRNKLHSGIKKGLKKPTISQIKQRLYEVGPFSDPRKEKERKNAVNAKKNRDLQKNFLSTVQREINELKLVNSKLIKKADLERKKLLEAKREIKLLKIQLKTTTQ